MTTSAAHREPAATMSKLSDYCQIIMGQSPPGASYSNVPKGLPFFQGKADFGPIHPVTRVWCSAPLRIAESGDILLSVRAPVGPVNVADQQCCIGRGLAAIRPLTGLDAGYLYWVLKRSGKTLEDRSSGSTFQAIGRSDLDRLVIPVPGLIKQKRIAAKLDEQMATLASALAALAAQREAATALRSAVLRAALDPATHPDWQVLPIGQVTMQSIDTWNVIASPNETKEYVEIAGIDSSSKTIASTHTIVAHAAPSRARNIIHAGDVLVATTRPNLNAIAVVPDLLNGQVCSTGFAVLRPGKNVLSKWLYWNVRSPRFVQMASNLVVGAMYPAITDAQVRAICTPVPRLSVQRQITESLDVSMRQIDSMVTSFDSQATTLDSLRTSLLDAAFSGQM